MRKVVFLHSKFPKSPHEIESLFTRWNMYGQRVNTYASGSRILIFSLKRKISLDSSKYLYLSDELNYKSNSIVNYFNLFTVIARDSANYTVVTGDNQTSLLYGLLLRLRFPKRIRLQVQFHGNTYDSSVNKGFAGKIRVLTSRLAILFSDSIRIVSKFQENEIKAIAQKKVLHFVCSPVPIDFRKIPTQRAIQSIDLLIVGRLHAERGTKEMVAILNELMSKDPLLRITVVGSGPDQKWIENQLRLDLNDETITFAGQVTAELLREYYAKSKILLSTAPHEGYGLTIREAALSGLRVVARRSAGATEAAKAYGSVIQMYESQEDARQVILQSIASDLNISLTELKNLQLDADNLALDYLVKSWIDD